MYVSLPVSLQAHHCPDCGARMDDSVISHDPEKGSVVVFYCDHCGKEQVLRIPASDLVTA